MNIGTTTIDISRGNLYTTPVDAVVHMTTGKLTGMYSNGGVFSVAGPELFKACMRLGPLKSGEVDITLGYNLPAKFIIHAIGPQFGKENGYEASYLEDCHIKALQLAEKKQLTSIAFPSFCGGVYAYPVVEAASIALETVQEFLHRHPQTTL